LTVWRQTKRIDILLLSAIKQQMNILILMVLGNVNEEDALRINETVNFDKHRS